MTRSEHERWMEHALELARYAAQIGEVPIGAVIVKDGQKIGEGYNRREIDQNPLGHAELMAIAQASQRLGGWRLQQCYMYVTLEPCPMCAGAIVQARMSHLIYGTKDPKAGYAGSLYNVLQDDQLNHTVSLTAGVKAEEARHMLQHFFRQLRNGND